MNFDLQSILLAMRATVRQPREGAKAILALNLPLSVGLMALALMLIVSSMLSAIAAGLFMTDATEGLAAMLTNPLQMVLTQSVVLAITVMLVIAIGQRFGGRGSLAEAVVLMAWLEAILNVLQAVQLVLLFLSPTLADMVGFLSILLFLWLLANFVAELHGFQSAAKVLLMIFAVGFVLSFVMAFLGVAIFGLEAANV